MCRRIFVVGTGRCGTTTFYQACKWITNYTCGHESAAGRLPPICYPDSHIEVAGHLSMQLGLLTEQFPDAKWVHLIRERNSCIDSIASTAQIQLDAWARHWCQKFQADPRDIAASYYDCLNANIRLGLRDKDFITVHTGSLENWEEFWNWSGARGNLIVSSEIWSQRKYNARESRGKENYVSNSS